MKRRLWLIPALFLAAFAPAQLSAQAQANADALLISPTDLRIENSNEGGYLLLVRAKPGIKSILLSESSEPEGHKLATYTMRTKLDYPINNDQKRILNGKVLNRPDLHFLVSSTPVPDPQFGSAFRLFIPYVIEYGFPEGRHGERQITNGAYLSIRSFELPWADYSGRYKDNSYKLVLTQVTPPEQLGDGYNKEALASFQHLADKTKVSLIKQPQELGQTIESILAKLDGPEIDLVLCLDATGSMVPYQDFVRQKLVPMLQKFLEAHPKARFGFVQYRDYFEQFLYEVAPLTTNFQQLQVSMNHYRPLGGGDIPEAVDEALYGAMTELKWQAPKRAIILVGDAPPHPRPFLKITHEMVDQAKTTFKVEIYPVLLPSGPLGK